MNRMQPTTRTPIKNLGILTKEEIFTEIYKCSAAKHFGVSRESYLYKQVEQQVDIIWKLFNKQ